MKMSCTFLSIFLFIAFQAFGQNLIVFSEPTSHFRGNKSINVGVQIDSDKYLNSFGVDYIYSINSTERTVQNSNLSYGLNYKFGFRLNQKDVGSPCHVLGLNLKYSRLNIFQLDSDFDKSWTEKEHIFRKSYNKIVPLLFYQYQFLVKKSAFFAVQVGAGVPFITNAHIQKDNQADVNLTKIEGWDFSTFPEHGFHRNESGSFTSLALQFNFLVGYRFFEN